MNYNVLVTDEATEDIFDLVRYIHMELGNPDAASRLYSNLYKQVNSMGIFPLKFSDSGIRYRGYVIHKKVYQTYLLFYIIRHENKSVYVLRILKDRINWQKILEMEQTYHLPQSE